MFILKDSHNSVSMLLHCYNTFNEKYSNILYIIIHVFFHIVHICKGVMYVNGHYEM